MTEKGREREREKEELQRGRSKYLEKAEKSLVCVCTCEKESSGNISSLLRSNCLDAANATLQEVLRKGNIKDITLTPVMSETARKKLKEHTQD